MTSSSGPVARSWRTCCAATTTSTTRPASPRSSARTSAVRRPLRLPGAAGGRDDRPARGRGALVVERPPRRRALRIRRAARRLPARPARRPPARRRRRAHPDPHPTRDRTRRVDDLGPRRRRRAPGTDHRQHARARRVHGELRDDAPLDGARTGTGPRRRDRSPAAVPRHRQPRPHRLLGVREAARRRPLARRAVLSRTSTPCHAPSSPDADAIASIATQTRGRQTACTPPGSSGRGPPPTTFAGIHCAEIRGSAGDRP